MLGACAMLVTAFATAAASGSGSGAANEKIKVTLLTKATGGFWDAMIAGAKKYAKDHPTEIQLTTNACKTNDDTPCQIAEIQDAVTKGAKAIVISPMGVGVTAALNKAKKAGVRIVFVDNTIPCRPDCGRRDEQRQGLPGAGAYIKTRLKSGDTIGLLEAVRGVPNLDQRIDGVKKALKGTGVKVVIGAQQTLCDTKTGPRSRRPPHQVPGPHRDLLGV